MVRITRKLLVLIGLICFVSRTALCADKLVVHEWGTFTSFQDETGAAIGGINTDDEPVPEFVHNIANGLLISRAELPSVFYQGTPSCHPDVTMRLETPVLYFHADKDFHGRVDVRVEFKSGWLTQFYPDAAATPESLTRGSFGKLDGRTTGSLTWSNLELNTATTGPETSQHVWLAPRAVDALQVKAEKGEAEKYLFYRGVANLNAPLQVTRPTQGTLNIAGHSEHIHTFWYADIRKDGTAAYRTLDAANPTTAANFVPSDYKTRAITALRLELRAALVSAGLFGDEADALLNTWELSYFKSSGARLFFLVPQEWTDSVMPLSVSGQHADIVRVMVGRIELVSPEQRALLEKIAAGPVPDSWNDFRQPLEKQFLKGDYKDWNALFDGSKKLKDLGFKPPELWQSYLDLGRFRNALVLDEVKHRPTDALKEFIKHFGLEGYDSKE